MTPPQFERGAHPHSHSLLWALAGVKEISCCAIPTSSSRACVFVLRRRGARRRAEESIDAPPWWSLLARTSNLRQTMKFTTAILTVVLIGASSTTAFCPTSSSSNARFTQSLLSSSTVEDVDAATTSLPVDFQAARDMAHESLVANLPTPALEKPLTYFLVRRFRVPSLRFYFYIVLISLLVG